MGFFRWRTRRKQRYAGQKSEYDLHFADEGLIERRRRRRRALIKTRALFLTFGLGVATSYLASAVWTKWPLIQSSGGQQVDGACGLNNDVMPSRSYRLINHEG